LSRAISAWILSLVRVSSAALIEFPPVVAAC